MNKNELLTICNFVRSKLEKVQHLPNDYDIGLDILRKFPTGCCKVASFIMMQYLYSKKNIPKENLSLITYNERLSDREQGQLPNSHAWFKYKNLHVDLTGDQFDKPAIIVSSINPWTETWKNWIYTEYPFKDEEFSVNYLEALERICVYLNE